MEEWYFYLDKNEPLDYMRQMYQSLMWGSWISRNNQVENMDADA